MAPAPAGAPWVLLAAALLSLLACASQPEPVMSTQVIPLQSGPGGSGTARDQLYANILGQCRQAHRDADVERLAGLLDRYDRSDAPDWAREQMGAFRQVLDTLRFTRDALSRRALVCQRARFHAGEEIPLTLSLRSQWSEVIRLSARAGGRASQLLVEIAVRDEDGRGNTSLETTTLPVPLETDVDLQPGGEWQLPFPVPTAVERQHLIRNYEFRAELILASVRVGGRELLTHRVPVDGCKVQVMPAGYEPIEQEPLKTLRRALARGQERYFDHAYLSCELLPAEHRVQAGDLLVATLRNAPLAHVPALCACMSKLFGQPKLSRLGLETPVVDRDDWLQWWQEARDRL